jgi:hypothetical protein
MENWRMYFTILGELGGAFDCFLRRLNPVRFSGSIDQRKLA